MTETLPKQSCQTRYFGPVEYDTGSVIEFPDGIPAFEQERRFLAIRQPINEPLVFLQSLANPDLCFVTLPVQTAKPGFRLHVAPEDLKALELAVNRQPVVGREVLCLALIALEENAPPSANLLAPIIVNIRTLRARQAIQTDSPYSHREVLAHGEAACS